MQHPDEGTIHAWLDGELSPEEAARAEAHVSDCAECRALVAEARGLIAASTRILTALDDVPSGVIPAGDSSTADGVTPVRRHRWYDRTDFRAAAALLFVAGASLVVAKVGGNSKTSLRTAATAVERTAPALSLPAGTVIPQPPPTPSERKTEIENVAGGSVKNESADTGRAPAAAARRTDAVTTDAASKALMQPMAVAAAPPKVSAKLADSTATRGAVSADFVRAESVSSRIEGRVTDQLGRGLAQASVIVQGTNLSATTDTAGHFRIENVPAGEQRVIVRRIGYRPQTVPVSMNDRVATANATMAVETAQLSEVVVTGMATSPAAANAAKTTVQRLDVATPREISVDSSGNVRRTTYEVSPGLRVILVESPVEVTRERDLQAARKTPGAVAAAVPPPTNTISWIDRDRSYTLTGPFSTSELEAIRLRLMKMRK